jgi:hypothetical protein
MPTTRINSKSICGLSTVMRLGMLKQIMKKQMTRKSAAELYYDHEDILSWEG